MLKIYNKKLYLKVSKKALLLTSVFCLLSLEISSQDYADVFTNSIYEQSNIVKRLTSLHIPEDKIDEELMKDFLRKKEEALEESFSKGIRKEIEFLSSQYIPLLEKMLWENLLSHFPLVIGETSYAIIKTSPNIALLTQFLSQKIINENFSGSAKEFIISKKSELMLKMQKLKNGLHTESILELEKAYVKRKRKIADTALKEQIEEGFLGLRKTDYYLERTIQKGIAYTLKLPVRREVLFDTVSSPAARRRLLEEIANNALINSYEQTLRGELRDIITNIADVAAHHNSNISRKRSYVLKGNPSNGKTRAAREIAAILRLPYYEITIQDPSEVSRDNLAGLNALWPNATPGWFASALMASLDGNDPVKNSILIINDLDRIDMKTHPSVYNFLLSFLDPGKKTYYNPYFETEIDISQLIVILTVNNPLCDQQSILGETKQDGKPEALLTRLSKTVTFPDFSESTKRELVSEELQKLKGGYPVLKPFNFEYESILPTKITLKVSYNSKQLSSYSPATLFPIFRNISEEMSPMARALNGLSFSLNFDVSGSTLRQLIDTGILSHSLSTCVNKLTLLSSEAFFQATQEQNVGSSTPLYLKSAVCGHEEAIFFLASQMGIAKRKKLFWLKKGSELKHIRSIEGLGDHYNSVNKKARASHYYSQAFLLGSYTHEEELAEYYTSHANNDKALKQVSKLYKRKPTSSILAEKIYQLGDYFLSKNQFEKALDCFKLVADLDMPKHSESLVRFAKKIEQEEELGNAKAITLYKEAADNGNFDAAYRIGLHYRDFSDGKSTSCPEKDKKALEWFRKAAMGEHPDSQYQRYQDVDTIYHLPNPLWTVLALVERPLRITYDLYLGNDDKQSTEWFTKAANN